MKQNQNVASLNIPQQGFGHHQPTNHWVCFTEQAPNHWPFVGTVVVSTWSGQKSVFLSGVTVTSTMKKEKKKTQHVSLPVQWK